MAVAVVVVVVVVVGVVVVVLVVVVTSYQLPVTNNVFDFDMCIFCQVL